MQFSTSLEVKIKKRFDANLMFNMGNVLLLYTLDSRIALRDNIANVLNQVHDAGEPFFRIIKTNHNNIGGSSVVMLSIYVTRAENGCFKSYRRFYEFLERALDRVRREMVVGAKCVVVKKSEKQEFSKAVKDMLAIASKARRAAPLLSLKV